MKSFYDRPREERIGIATSAIAERRTVLERWAALALEPTEGWNPRAALAARLLDGCDAVTDLGCGAMSLRRHLRAGIRYVPVDVVARDAHTAVVDLNAQPLPDFGTEAVAALGLLEYIYDVPALLRRMATLHRVAVVSYNPAATPDADDDRLQHLWANGYTLDGLAGLFRDAGLAVDAMEMAGATQFVWRLLAGP